MIDRDYKKSQSFKSTDFFMLFQLIYLFIEIRNSSLDRVSLILSLRNSIASSGFMSAR